MWSTEELTGVFTVSQTANVADPSQVFRDSVGHHGLKICHKQFVTTNKRVTFENYYFFPEIRYILIIPVTCSFAFQDSFLSRRVNQPIPCLWARNCTFPGKFPREDRANRDHESCFLSLDTSRLRIMWAGGKSRARTQYLEFFKDSCF